MGLDSTVIPAVHTWSLEAQRYLTDSPSRIALLVFINIPVIVIVLNVLRQLVRSRAPSLTLCR